MKKKEPSKFTLDEYNKRFSKKKSNLLKISEKDLKEFDNKYKTNNYLLKDRKWTKIGNDYYEVPEKTKNPIKWFKRLSTKGKIITSFIVSSIVAASVVVPVIYFNTDHWTNFSTVVRRVSSPEFGNVDFEATMKDFNSHGFEYGDIVNVKFYNPINNNDDYEFTVPIVTNYNEVGQFAPCLCNYENKSEYLDMSFAMHPIKNDSDKLVGKKVDFKMVKKGGYNQTRELVKCPQKLTFEEVGASHTRYANFRDPTLVGIEIGKHMDSGKFYRGSSPFNYSANGEGRFLTADYLMKLSEVTSEISLSCDDETVKKYMDNLENSYTKELYEKGVGAFYTHNFGGDYFTFKQSNNSAKVEAGGNIVHDLVENMYYAVKNVNNPVFYFHCNEGKDRTGFFSMLFEALCGVSISDIVYDYMLTFTNYYNISNANDPKKFNALANQTIYRFLYSICIDNPSEELYKIDWYGDFDAKSEVNKILTEGSKSLQDHAFDYLSKLCNEGQEDEWADKIKTIQTYLKKSE